MSEYILSEKDKDELMRRVTVWVQMALLIGAAGGLFIGWCFWGK